MSGPLAGIRVVEVSMWAFVPSCGAALADMGADVIKIETPTGDPSRNLNSYGVAPGTGGLNFMYEIFNRSKRSMAMDLNAEGSLDVLHKLLETADVFLVSLLPATRRKLKIDLDDIVSRHPNIIYAAGNGQGVRGPDGEKGGYDAITYWGRSGVTNGVTPVDHPYPLPMPSAGFGDVTSGIVFAGGIAAAIAKRAMTGKASVVDGSLFATALWAMQAPVAANSLTGEDRRMRSADRTKVPNPLSNSYRTSDNRFIVLNMLQGQKYWPGFCEAVGNPELIDDPRFSSDEDRKTNSVECVGALDAIFATRTLEEWKPILASQPGQWDIIQTVPEVIEDSATLANDFIQTVDYGDGRAIKMVSVPVQFDRQALKSGPAPDLGAQSDEILSELGYDEDQIIDLKVAGIIE